MTSTAVGLSRDLPPKRVMRAQIGDQDLVLWRAPDGALAAWDNRCPHRGMALSHGFVRGGMLACLYHGWHYGQDGGCKVIPAHPGLEPPETIRARIFNVVEATGVIWVDLEDEAHAPPLPSDMSPLRSLEIMAAAAEVTSALAGTKWQGAKAKVEGTLYHFGTLRIVALLNPIEPKRTQVTLLSNASLGDKRALSRWCDAVRRKAEVA